MEEEWGCAGRHGVGEFLVEYNVIATIQFLGTKD
jgi:hypothetical protein